MRERVPRADLTIVPVFKPCPHCGMPCKWEPGWGGMFCGKCKKHITRWDFILARLKEVIKH